MDQENNRPGVPTQRVAIIRHAAFTVPQILLSHATVTPMATEGHPATLHHGFDRLLPNTTPGGEETIRPSWKLEHTMLPADKAPEGGFQAALGQRMFIEVIAPQMALGVTSKIEIFAQTDQGRSGAGQRH